MRRRGPSIQALRALHALSGMPGGEGTGADVLRATGLPSGTVYPVLARLEKEGALTSRWEDADPAAAGRPRKRYYRVTPLGSGALRAAVADLSPGPGDRAAEGSS